MRRPIAAATAAVALLTLTACAETVQQSEGTFNYRGDTYRSVTRTFQREDGSTYMRRTIYFGAERVSCRADDDKDCELAISTRLVRDRGV